MAVLTDVARTHIYQKRGRAPGGSYLLHPYEVTRGPNAGLFEVGRTLSSEKKKSAHLTIRQLAELFAHDCFEQFNIRLRMKDAAGTYPVSPPRLHPRREDIVAGSDFERLIQSFDTKLPLSSEVEAALRRLEVVLPSGGVAS